MKVVFPWENKMRDDQITQLMIAGVLYLIACASVFYVYGLTGLGTANCAVILNMIILKGLDE
jgi:hypothetical protein